MPFVAGGHQNEKLESRVASDNAARGARNVSSTDTAEPMARWSGSLDAIAAEKDSSPSVMTNGKESCGALNKPEMSSVGVRLAKMWVGADIAVWCLTLELSGRCRE